ncbi:MAG TPA: hypothetical protein VER96_08590 [Polyangiaceae bacterium]|nr:hypothetical protein [Polyangiaceae bacterium]
MAADLIVIEIAAPKVSESALSVLVSACSRAARDAECVLARNANEEQPAAVAIVTLQSEDKIRVEVGVRRGDHDSWRTKDFAFLASDEIMDRWRAVGFAIGTLAESNPSPEQETSERVGPASPTSSTAARSAAAAATAPASSTSTSESATSAPSAAASSTAKSASPAKAAAPAAKAAAPAAKPADDIPLERPPAVDERARRTEMFIGAAVIFGPGLDTDPPWRLGSALYLDLAPARMPVFFTVGGSAATRLRSGSNGVTTRWFDVSLGGGVPLIGRLDASGLEFRVQALAEYFDAHASDIDQESQTMSRWTLGVQGAFGGRVQIVPNLLLTAEVQAAGLTGETEVKVHGSPLGTSASFRYLGCAGLRVQLR